MRGARERRKVAQGRVHPETPEPATGRSAPLTADPAHEAFHWEVGVNWTHQ